MLYVLSFTQSWLAGEKLQDLSYIQLLDAVCARALCASMFYIQSLCIYVCNAGLLGFSWISSTVRVIL